MSKRVRSLLITALIVAFLSIVIVSGCISQAEGEVSPDDTRPYTIEEYRENEIYRGGVNSGNEIPENTSLPVPAQTPEYRGTNPYSTEKNIVVCQSEELSVLIENSSKNIIPLSDKLKFRYTSKSAVKRLQTSAEKIKDLGISERKELMRLTLSEDYLVAKLKYKHFLDAYIDNSGRVITQCEMMIEVKSYGSDTKYDNQLKDFSEERIEDYDEADEYLLEAKDIIENINA